MSVAISRIYAVLKNVWVLELREEKNNSRALLVRLCMCNAGRELNVGIWRWFIGEAHVVIAVVYCPFFNYSQISFWIPRANGVVTRGESVKWFLNVLRTASSQATDVDFIHDKYCFSLRFLFTARVNNAYNSQHFTGLLTKWSHRKYWKLLSFLFIMHIN